ncbi:MAG: SCO family protein [Chloroflexota bacterium]
MKRLLPRLFYGLAGLIVAGAFAFKIFQPIQVLPRIRLAPAFALTDQNSQRVTNEDLRGKIVLYNFTYTNCPAPCYDMNATLKDILTRREEAALGDVPFVLVTISFDPARDTPSALHSYAEAIPANPADWIFATATDASLLKIIVGAGFETYYEPKDDGSFAFDPAFILVDGWGIIRGEYRYSTEVSTADRILRHLSVLADEVNHSKGSARLAYEAAHLFLCYAQ